MALTFEQPPHEATLIEGPQQQISRKWWIWLTTSLIPKLLTAALNVMPNGPTRLLNQSASIAATTLYTTAGPGLYLVLWYARITTADAVSSSLTVALSGTDSVVCTKTFPAITGNTTATIDSGVLLFRPSATPSAVKYATTYASNTPVAMRYSLEMIVLQLA